MEKLGHGRSAATRRRHDRIGFALAAVLVIGLFTGTVFAVRRYLAMPDPRIAAGRAEFQRFCSGCHGEDARGTGTLAVELPVRPKDLTTIALRHGATFDVVDVARFIDGRADVAAHGPRGMPVWAEVWRDDGDGAVAERIDAIVVWLWSVQR